MWKYRGRGRCGRGREVGDKRRKRKKGSERKKERERDILMSNILSDPVNLD